jgi:hypothetical protein
MILASPWQRDGIGLRPIPRVGELNVVAAVRGLCGIRLQLTAQEGQEHYGPYFNWTQLE